ncbi:MAG: hypothetical protein R2771_08460 [Saprospiraceae bacterium]
MKKYLLIIIGIFGINYVVFSQNFIQCPPDITISCCQDYNDINITGDAADINISFNYFTHADLVDVDECRVGEIKRTWTGYNNVGHFDCDQIISLRRDHAFEGLINWPSDWAGTCEDAIPYSEPEYALGFCDQVGHTFHMILSDLIQMPVLRY